MGEEGSGLGTSTEVAPGDRSVGAAWRLWLFLCGAQLLGGVLTGLIWRAWSPRSVSFVLDIGGGRGVIVPDESEAQVAADGRFFVLTVVVAVIAALLTWRARSQRGPGAAVALAVGSIVGSLSMRGVGQTLSAGRRSGPVNTAFHPPLTLHATPMLLVGAFLAVVMYTGAAVLSNDPDLAGRRAESAEVATRPVDEVPDGPTG
jgi:hypothetical protein